MLGRPTRSAAAHATIVHLEASEGAALRAFCLETIAEVFGVHYRTDWHADLDALATGDHHYLPDAGGAFLVARAGDRVIGCGGLRSLTTRPDLAARFSDRHDGPVGSIWRVFVAPEWRCAGLGARLSAALDLEAAMLGYRSLYLHTSAETPRSVAFWQRQGYEACAVDGPGDDRTVHMDKPIDVAALAQRSGSAMTTGSYSGQRHHRQHHSVDGAAPTSTGSVGSASPQPRQTRAT
ncbi:MAG: GNAT family N-acetyltransferase [Actinomycetota bacterium]